MAKRCMLVPVLLLAVTLLSTAFQGQGQTAGNLPGPRFHFNPKPFDKFLAPVSGTVAFLLSPRGQEMLKVSPHPLAPFLLRVGGTDLRMAAGAMLAPSRTAAVSRTSQTEIPRGILPSPSFPGTVNSSCGTSYGTRFNREGNGTSPAPFAVPQDEETVDAIVGGGASGADLVVEGAVDFRGLYGALGSSETGYYVQRSGTDCAPEFEGGAPSSPDPLAPGSIVLGSGDPVVRRDASRGAFFEADLRVGVTFPSTTAIGVQRTTVTNLNDTTLCPGPIQNTDAAARTCWPNGIVINPLPICVSEPCSTIQAYFNDKPHMAVDERASGTGAGNVYVTATEFDFFGDFSRTWLASCTNTLTACSSPTVISGSDTATQFSHVSVRPNGVVNVTYDSFGFDLTGNPFIDIQFVSCQPAAAPATPSCKPPTTVYQETMPLMALGSNDFRVTSYPKHDHRTNGATTETFVIWERCHVTPANTVSGVCPKSEIVMIESNDGGATWSSPAGPGVPALVDTAGQDQFFPWINTDRVSGTVNIDYYTATNDAFSHKVQVKLAQINPGGTFPEAITGGTVLTSVLNDPAADPLVVDTFFGDYIGVIGVSDAQNTVHRAYVGYTANYWSAPYGGAAHKQQDNYLTRFDY